MQHGWRRRLIMTAGFTTEPERRMKQGKPLTPWLLSTWTAWQKIITLIIMGCWHLKPMKRREEEINDFLMLDLAISLMDVTWGRVMKHHSPGAVPLGNSWHLPLRLSLRFRVYLRGWELYSLREDVMYEVLPFIRNYFWPSAVRGSRINGVSHFATSRLKTNHRETGRPGMGWTGYCCSQELVIPPGGFLLYIKKDLRTQVAVQLLRCSCSST